MQEVFLIINNYQTMLPAEIRLTISTIKALPGWPSSPIPIERENAADPVAGRSSPTADRDRRTSSP
jgi:hypothetical protein